MKRIFIGSIKEHIGKAISITGWLRIIRSHGGIVFLILSDISGTVQIVVTKEQKEIIDICSQLTTESVLMVSGLVQKEEQAPGGLEIKVKALSVLSKAESGLPISVIEKTKNDASLEHRLNWRWLDLRKPQRQLIFKVWTVMEHAFRSYCIDNGYIEIHSPKIMGAASESGGELFEIKYFDRKAYLAQSPQFYKQMAMAAGFEKVFEIGPVFRANPSFTSRHDTEFTMYDVEISFIKDHFDLMAEEEKMIVTMLSVVKEKYGKEIKKYYNRDLIVPTIPFPKVTMEEALKILVKLGITNERNGDLSPEGERELCKYFAKKTGHELLFVTDWPISVRPFYHIRYEDKPKITKSFDLLWNGLEITTGAQREHRLERLKTQAREKGLDLNSIKKYLDFFRYGCPPHGGFAPGPTRMLMKIFDVGNVREVTYLYRGVKRLTP